MTLRAKPFWLVVAAAAIAACTNGGGLGGTGGGGGSPTPLPSSAIGVGIPTGKIGVENDRVWGTISGYTQQQTSQVLAFPPGAKITVKNLSSNTPHTLNVLAQTNGPPPNWPRSPSLSFSPSGNGVLSTTYASGTLAAGASVMVTLSNPGIYLIGCAYHYVSNNMRDVIEVVNGATPGPTASPGPGGYAIMRHHAAHRTQPMSRRAAASDSTQPHLIDQRGRSFTLQSLRGEPLAMTFISAHCTDACPLINAQFADAARRIAAAHISAHLLTVTLDPAKDSPADMRELARRFGANPRYWLVASGSVADISTIMRAFSVEYVKGKGGYREEHTTFVYIFGANGELAKTMLASSGLSDDIVEAVRSKSVASR